MDMETIHRDYSVSTQCHDAMEYKVSHAKSFAPVYHPWSPKCRLGVASVPNFEGRRFTITCVDCYAQGPDAYYSHYAATFNRHLRPYSPHPVPDCCAAKLVDVFLNHLRAANAADVNYCSVKNWKGRRQERAPFNTFHDFQLHAQEPPAASEEVSDHNEMMETAIRDSFEEAGPAGMRPATKESVKGLLKVRRKSTICSLCRYEMPTK